MVGRVGRWAGMWAGRGTGRWAGRRTSRRAGERVGRWAVRLNGVGTVRMLDAGEGRRWQQKRAWSRPAVGASVVFSSALSLVNQSPLSVPHPPEALP